MKRTTVPVALALMGALALAACSSSAPAANDAPEVPARPNVQFAAGTTMAKLQEAGTMTIGTKFDQPLFGLMGLDNVPQGFDVEIGKLIAAEIGIPANQVQWVESVSANREPFIQKGEVDLVIATYTINDDRKKVVSFGGPYYVAGQDLLVLDGNPDAITGITDVAGKKVCSVTGSTSAENLTKAGVDVLATDTYSNCLEPLRSGEVVAVSTDNVILAGLADQNPGEFEVIGAPFTAEDYGIGLKKGDVEFQNFINDTLEAAFADGRWAEAWERTAGTVLDTPTPPTITRD